MSCHSLSQEKKNISLNISRLSLLSLKDFVINYRFFKRFYLFIFREKRKEGGKEEERERERERKKSMCGCFLYASCWGHGPQPRHALTRNRAGNALVGRPVLNPLSYTSRGINYIFNKFQFPTPFQYSLMFLTLLLDIWVQVETCMIECLVHLLFPVHLA